MHGSRRKPWASAQGSHPAGRCLVANTPQAIPHHCLHAPLARACSHVGLAWLQEVDQDAQTFLFGTVPLSPLVRKVGGERKRNGKARRVEKKSRKRRKMKSQQCTQPASWSPPGQSCSWEAPRSQMILTQPPAACSSKHGSSGQERWLEKSGEVFPGLHSFRWRA